MIVDSSALVAIVFEEPGHSTLVDRLVGSPRTGIGAPTLVETGVVLSSRLGRDAGPLLARMLDVFDIVQVPFGDAHWRAALDAYLRFGRGRHRASLNLGDCFSYAVARLADEPLLFVGDDFSMTDVEAA